jgi:hypothetical protein
VENAGETAFLNKFKNLMSTLILLLTRGVGSEDTHRYSEEGFLGEYGKIMPAISCQDVEWIKLATGQML